VNELSGRLRRPAGSRLPGFERATGWPTSEPLPAARRGEPGRAVLTGYVVVDAADLDAAATLAASCPGLADGVDVEVAEVIPS
jgi:hypothetical protein